MTVGKAVFNLDILAFSITDVTEPKSEGDEICHALIRIRRVSGHIADHRHRLLRAHRQRPRGCRTAERDERAALHSMTSSASTSNLSGISRPSAFAVLKLI